MTSASCLELQREYIMAYEFVLTSKDEETFDLIYYLRIVANTVGLEALTKFKFQYT